jgi:hypothetical protein
MASLLRFVMDQNVNALVDYLGACERIFRSPIPLVYTRHTGRFITSFMVLVPLAIWIYTLVFAFAALWFSHFLLAALAKQRGELPVSDGIAPLVADEVLHAAPPALTPPAAPHSLWPPP